MIVHTAQRTQSGFLCGTRTPSGESALAERLEQALLRLVWLEQKRLAQALAVHGLTVSQFLVLASLWQRQDGCQMGQLAEQMLQSSATMTGIVDRLVRMDFVERQTAPLDRRVVVIDLTERGRDVLSRVQREKLHQLQRVLDGLPESDGVSLVRLIEEYLDQSIDE